MNSLRRFSLIATRSLRSRQSLAIVSKLTTVSSVRLLHCSVCLQDLDQTARPVRRKKQRCIENTSQYFIDVKQVRVKGGTGGDGAVSFLHLWVNDKAGPDGGDGGHGGHVVFQASQDVKDLSHIRPLVAAEHGERGYAKDCFGKNAEHTIIKVPMGTIVRNIVGNILADMDEEGMMFLAARGGAGGHGNAFFLSNSQQAPLIAECGAVGEEKEYVLEIKSMAHVGLIGLPNAGKSTLLRAITRARPKVASYPFTTLKPHLGMVLYDDYEQIAVADLPGLISDSHKNRGLGIMFLKHAERCSALLYIIDVSREEPWTQLEILQHEITQFSKRLIERPSLVIANKIDVPGANEKLEQLKQKIDLPIMAISAKHGTNLRILLTEIRKLYDKEVKVNDEPQPLE